MKTALTIVIAGAFVGGALLLSGSGDGAGADLASVANVSVSNGTQIVDIGVKGGYSPKVTAAKADMPTTLRLKTSGTFDCSSAIVIPSLSYRKHLPPLGETVINVPPQKSGTTLEGLCAMGMYHFTILFQQG